jgi:hypothetical protein
VDGDERESSCEGLDAARCSSALAHPSELLNGRFEQATPNQHTKADQKDTLPEEGDACRNSGEFHLETVPPIRFLPPEGDRAVTPSFRCGHMGRSRILAVEVDPPPCGARRRV